MDLFGGPHRDPQRIAKAGDREIPDEDAPIFQPALERGEVFPGPPRENEIGFARKNIARK